MDYWIVEIAGKQYQVTPRDQILVDRLPGSVGDQLELKSVLLEVNGTKISLGRPYLDKVLSAKILEHSQGPKIRVSTYKAKSRYRRTLGHRHKRTLISIESLARTSAKKSTPAKP